MTQNTHHWSKAWVTALCASVSVTAAAPFAAAEDKAASQSDKSQSARTASERPDGRAPSGLLALGNGSQYYSPYAFVVDKKARKLTIWQQENDQMRQVAEYPADLGKKEGEKKSKGDHRTPEGIYFLLDRLEGPSLDFQQYGQRAFTTDYPNFFDRIDGKTGNGIWLHAVPDSVPLTRGSRGCVVVRNNVIAEVSQYIKLQKTPILIQDQVDFLSQSEIQERSRHLTTLLEAWRQAWEKKDIETYISFYGQNFRGQNMNRDQWKAYKGRLNGLYKSLSVRFSKPVIYAFKDRAVVRVLQAYASDQHADFGEKTLYLTRENGLYKIVGEDWAVETSPLARQEVENDRSSNGSTAVSACTGGSPCTSQNTVNN